VVLIEGDVPTGARFGTRRDGHRVGGMAVGPGIRGAFSEERPSAGVALSGLHGPIEIGTPPR